MKNKAFLPILEQLCMIFIFAVACAVCLSVFSFANKISRDRDSLDKSVIIAQNAAELLKSNKGDLQACAQILSGNADEDSLVVFYDKDGLPVDNNDAAYLMLSATIKDAPNELTRSAEIEVTRNGETVFELEILWQAGGLG